MVDCSCLGRDFRLRTADTNGRTVHPPGDMRAWKVMMMIQRGKLLTCPPELSGNPTSRYIWGEAGGMDEGVRVLHICV
jgi:hypothetical protein